jgi:NAD(P)-dependent dehydrogenase (short-subunit alcohol dehydrogenase family)
MRFSGEVALVTGGGRGIGASIARELAEAAMRVAVAARTRRQVELVAEEIGGVALEVDVSDEPSVARMVKDTERKLGPIDVLVNNAGVMTRSDAGPFWEERREDWWSIFEVNVLGVYLCCRAVLGWMVGRGRGQIINVGSGAGYQAVMLQCRRHGVWPEQGSAAPLRRSARRAGRAARRSGLHDRARARSYRDDPRNSAMRLAGRLPRSRPGWYGCSPPGGPTGSAAATSMPSTTTSRT